MKAKEIALTIFSTIEVHMPARTNLDLCKCDEPDVEQAIAKGMVQGFQMLCSEMTVRYAESKNDTSKMAIFREFFQKWRAVVVQVRRKPSLEFSPVVSEALFTHYLLEVVGPAVVHALQQQSAFGGYVFLKRQQDQIDQYLKETQQRAEQELMQERMTGFWRAVANKVF